MAGELAADLAARVGERSAGGIANVLARLIRLGELSAGERLPTVRAFSAELGVSPATVSAAWNRLCAAGLIETAGKRGSRVRVGLAAAHPRRYATIGAGLGEDVALDLSSGVPDPALLPNVYRSLARIQRGAATSSYFEAPVLPELAELVLGDWPFPAEQFTVVDGAMDAVSRLLAATAGFGDTVIVEDPTFPLILDLLDARGLRAAAVAVDDEGPLAPAFARALTTRPKAAILQPRSHNPRGHALSPRRAGELARLLEDQPTLVIENDHACYISSQPAVSLGAYLPEQVVCVRSFSKSHGPDLRLAGVGGSGQAVAAVTRDRLLGPGWSSRLLQAVLVDLLRDPVAVSAVRRARAVYAERRAAFAQELAGRGLQVHGQDGLNVWVEVPDERSAHLRLALRGIASAIGRPFWVDPPAGKGYLRLTCARLPVEDAAGVARTIAESLGEAGSAQIVR